MGRPKGSKNKKTLAKIAQENKEVIKTETLASVITKRLTIDDVLKTTKDSLNKLEGVSEALKPYHPRLGGYIEANINVIRRVITQYEEPDPSSLWNSLGTQSPPEWREIDKEIDKDFSQEIKKKYART